MTRSRSSYSSLFVLTLFVSILLHSVLGAGDDPTLDINRNAPKSRGSRFALAFMNNQARTLANTQQQITLFITTEQESSRFTLETRWSGVNGERFIETSPGSGLWSRTEIARRGEFTFINLPAGANGDEDIAIQDNGDDNIADRQKGVIITSENESDELTIYVLSDELVSTDAYMAINCVEFSSARDYRYFIFSSDVSGGETFRSRFLFTPCEDNTTVSVQPSQVMTHPNWVESSVSNTIARVEVTYGRRFNRFDTVMLSHMNDLTGSIITSNKPLSVIAGHQCGAPTNDGTCDYLVEQLPPHPTYGDLFFMAPFAVRQSGELYRIGSVTAGAQVSINCQCASSSADGSNRVALVSSGDGVYTATVGVGQYVECRTPANAQTYCCVTSTQPITMAGYTLGSRIDSLHNIVNPPLPFNPIADPAMIYIPPAKSYLNNYSFSTAQNLSTEFQGFLSYILLSQIFDNSEGDRQRFRINGETYIPDQYEAINCRVGGTNQVCAYGATKFMGQGNFDISYESTSTGAFWGFAYGYAREASFAYPLPFEMEPIGLAWIQAVDQVVVESLGIVDLEFSITRGDQSLRSRAYAVTQDLSAEAGSDYTTTGLRPGEGNSNLRWRRAAIFPNNRFIVSILVDSIPEPVEVVEVVVACDGNENCYLPRTRYTITIIDDEGACADLPAFPNGSISYDFRIFTEIGGRPYGTVATYECDDKRILVEPTRTCVNGEWTGREPSSCEIPPQRVEIMFSVAVFSFSESDGQGFVEIVADMAPSQSFDFVVTGSPNTQDFVITSAAGLPGQVTFPADQTSVRVSFNITNDEISVENLESYLATLSLTAGTIAAGVSLGALTQATVQIMDDDDVSVSVGQTTYNVQESDGSVTLSYVLNREAVRDVSFDVINVDGTAIGGGVDYSSAGYSLTIPARETNVSRSIAITMDGIAGEGNETFINRVSTINTANVGAGASDATVTIKDSDVVECPPLQPINNGFVTYKPGGLPKYSLGTLATYSCNNGFIFDMSTESKKRTCKEDIGITGVWNGLQPFCVPGCDAEVYQNYSWSNTALGSTALSPCPCVEILGVFAGKVSRQCSGSISKGGMWKDVIDVCETTNSGVSRELCNIALDLGLSSNKTTQASNQIANITSKPQNLTASQITLLTRIVEQVAEEAAANEEVRDGYLQTINNIQNVDADVIYESQLAMNSSTRILASVETFLDNLNTSTVSNSTSNQTVLSFETFAMTVQDLDPDSFQGQTFVVDLGPVDEEMNNTGVIDQDALMTFNDGNGDTSDNRSETGSPNKDAENSTASVHLNPSLFEDCLTTNGTLLMQRLSYSVFLSDVLFLPENRSTNQVGSIVVAARLACLQTNKTMLSVPVRTSFLIRMTDNVTNSSCALYRTQDRFGAWDTAGCREITSSNGRKDCECRQLGHFGILFDLNPTSLPENLSITLSIITYIGLGLSVICLLVFIFTIFISKELLVDKQNQILINMSISLICLYFTFLIGGFTVGVPPLCGVMSALLQYFFLVFFSWMAVEAVWLYIKLVMVMGSDSLTSKFMLKAGLPAWLFPLVIVAISTGVGYQYYSNPYYCRPTEWPFYFGFIFPFVIIYLLNWIVFVAIMVSICKHFANGNLSPLKDSSSRQQFRNFQKNLIIAMCLSVVLGLGWGLGLVSTSSGLVELSFIFQVIFSIFVGFQGVLIFFFYGLRSTDFRQTWTKLFNGCKSNTDNFVPFEKGITNTRDMFSPTAGVELLNVKTLPSKQHSPHNEEKELKEPKLNL